jgi:hypothetical protein
MDHGAGKCTCENDGWIDWFMRRAVKRPALLRPRGPERRAPRPLAAVESRLAELAEARGNDVIPALRKLVPPPSRRGFLKAAVLGAGGLLAWQGGLTPPPARACGGYEGNPA